MKGKRWSTLRKKAITSQSQAGNLNTSSWIAISEGTQKNSRQLSQPSMSHTVTLFLVFLNWSLQDVFADYKVQKIIYIWRTAHRYYIISKSRYEKLLNAVFWPSLNINQSILKADLFWSIILQLHRSTHLPSPTTLQLHLLDCNSFQIKFNLPQSYWPLLQTRPNSDWMALSIFPTSSNNT